MLIEFKTKQRDSQRSFIPVILLAVAVFCLVAGFLYIRYQQSHPEMIMASPAYVPGMVGPGDPDFEYYRTRIRLENVRASLGINFAQNRIAIIGGTIVNDGDRKLEALQMHIKLFDVDDQLYTEKTATPLRPDIGLKRSMNPLERRSFTVQIEPIEELWNSNRVEIELTGLKYH